MNYRISTIALIFGGTAFLFSAGCLAQSHCRRGEINYFSCTIKGSEKVASLCGNNLKYTYETNGRNGSLNGLTGSLQYRFGFPGKPEFVFPKVKPGSDSVARFKGFWTKGYRISYDEISFENQGVRYSLAFTQSSQTDESEGFVGVEVKRGAKTTRFSCDKWLVPQTSYSLDNDFPNDFQDLVRELDTTSLH